MNKSGYIIFINVLLQKPILSHAILVKLSVWYLSLASLNLAQLF